MDQAAHLRELVGTNQFKLLGLNPVGVFSVLPGAGRSLFASQMGYFLSEKRRRKVLIVEEVKNAFGFCGIPRFLGRTPGIRSETEIVKNRLSYIPFYGPMQHIQQIDIEPSYSTKFDYSFIEAESPFLGLEYGILMIAATDESLKAFERWFEVYAPSIEQWKNFGILVSPVKDGSCGSEFYRQINDIVVRENFPKIEYLGHLPRLKNAFRSLKKQEILLELEKGSSLNSCLSLILKRIGHWRLTENNFQKMSYSNLSTDVEIDNTMDR